jgi:pyridoxal biosynthesis lyase PdxS
VKRLLGLQYLLLELGGVARMSDPRMIKEIKNAVTIPVMAKVRIGHFVEAQVRGYS